VDPEKRRYKNKCEYPREVVVARRCGGISELGRQLHVKHGCSDVQSKSHCNLEFDIRCNIRRGLGDVLCEGVRGRNVREARRRDQLEFILQTSYVLAGEPSVGARENESDTARRHTGSINSINEALISGATCGKIRLLAYLFLAFSRGGHGQGDFHGAR